MAKPTRLLEGDVFEVPALGVRGVVARSDRGRLLAYFFPGGPLVPESALFVCRVDDRALTGAGERAGQGPVRWPRVSRIEGFSRSAWPVPWLYNEFTLQIARYDDNARHCIEERPAEQPAESYVGRDGQFGPLAVEGYLRKLPGLRAHEAA